MNDYEILLMLDPELPEERQGEVVTRVRELIEKGGGTWLSHDVWGRRRLAYEIDHKPDGAYHLLQFDVQPETLDEVSRVLKITDGVMRHMATRRPKGGGRTAAPPPLPEPEPARERTPEPASPPPSRPPEAEASDSEPTEEEYSEPTEPKSESETESEGGA